MSEHYRGKQNIGRKIVAESVRRGFNNVTYMLMGLLRRALRDSQ